MPIFDDDHLEYVVHTGHIQIVMDNGQQVPAYWSHPQLGSRFSGIVLLHDWWGVDRVARLLSSFFAQMGYYVIAPDLFDGETATTPEDAIKLVEKYQPTSYARVDSALSVLESHHQCNARVAAIGLGMGGSLAFEAAIKRDDLEAAIAYNGFPQRYLGKLAKANTPILAFYGSDEPYTKPIVIQALQDELAATTLGDQHEIVTLEGLAHNFFSSDLNPIQREEARKGLNQTLDFLEEHIGKLENSQDQEVI